MSVATRPSVLSSVSLVWSSAHGWVRAEPADLSRPAWPFGELTCDVLCAHTTVDGSMSLYRLDLHSRSVQRVVRRAGLPDLPGFVFTSAVDAAIAEARAAAGVTDVEVRGTLTVDDRRRPRISWETSAAPPAGPLAPRTLVTDGAAAVSRFSLRPGQPALARYADGRPLVVVTDGQGDPLDDVLTGLAAAANLRTEPGAVGVERLRRDVEAGAVVELCGWEPPGWVVPIGGMGEGADRREIGTGQPGPLLIRLWRKLSALHRAETKWPPGWMHVVR